MLASFQDVYVPYRGSGNETTIMCGELFFLSLVEMDIPTLLNSRLLSSQLHPALMYSGTKGDKKAIV